MVDRHEPRRAPIFNKLGYPHLAVTNPSPALLKRWPNMTFWLGLPSELVDGIVETFSKMNKDGKIGKKIAMIAVADRGYLIESGRIVGEGTGAALKQDPAVQRAYLGAG